MIDIQLVMNNAKTVQVEIDDKGDYWLHFNEGQNGIAAVVTRDLWLSLMSKVFMASSEDARKVITHWLERTQVIINSSDNGSDKDRTMMVQRGLASPTVVDEI